MRPSYRRRWNNLGVIGDYPGAVVMYDGGYESRYHTGDTKVSLEAIRNIEITYGGRFYIDKSGNAVYESRYHRRYHRNV